MTDNKQRQGNLSNYIRKISHDIADEVYGWDCPKCDQNIYHFKKKSLVKRVKKHSVKHQN